MKESEYIYTGNIMRKQQLHIKQFLKYINYFSYYLERLGRQMNGMDLEEPDTNGEYKVLESIVKNSKGSLCFIDGGSNIGNHIIRFNSLVKKYRISESIVFAVEPFPSAIEILRKNLSSTNYKLIDKALGHEIGQTKFYSDDQAAAGWNSVLPQDSLNTDQPIEVAMTTLDAIIQNNSLKKVNFLKLDIEGYEYNALLGAELALEKGLIDYIQVEYGGTWLQADSSIKKLMILAKKYSYRLYRIRKNDLLSIPSYHFSLDNFAYSNLLLVKDGCDLPLPSKRKANPLI